MVDKLFLSLSFVDERLVEAVYSRLPRGLAYFYKESFDNGELLLSAMERAVANSTIFVLFASKSGAESPWVNFEIDASRVQHIKERKHRILIFPTSSEVSHSDLPAWLRSYWVPAAGWSANDIARYITTILLDGGSSSIEAPLIIGRGGTQDKIVRMMGDHIQRLHQTPRVFVLAGSTGVGRRTFATHFMKTALNGAVNLRYGPMLRLSPQADSVDFYRSLRNEISVNVSSSELAEEMAAFQELDTSAQVESLNRLLAHFSSLGQAVTVVSTSGLFEDRGTPKDWVIPFLQSIPENATIFLVTNRMFDENVLTKMPAALQFRIEPLDDGDLKTLMIFSASRLGLQGFDPPAGIVKAVGGNAAVANSAVRLVNLKGVHILDRDPRQLFNIQNTILGENISEDAISAIEKRILMILGWFPELGGDLLRSLAIENETEEQFIDAVQSLVLGCLVIPSGHSFAIASDIRYLFRRLYVTPGDLVSKVATALKFEWDRAEANGEFRSDLFDAFVFMHALEGAALPSELRALLTPGTLYDTIRELYRRGKEAEDEKQLKQVVSWGGIAAQMKISDATLEEIQSLVSRALIRLGEYSQASNLIDEMAAKKFRSVPFLRGHMLRRKRDYGEAVSFLTVALKERKYNRSAAQELALCYAKLKRSGDLTKLITENEKVISDSALISDIRIGLALAKGDVETADKEIEILRRNPNDDGRSDIREAQMMIRRQAYRQAKDFLTGLLTKHTKGVFRLRMHRGVAAAKSGDFPLARDDLLFIKRLSDRALAQLQLETTILNEEGNVDAAQLKMNEIVTMGESDPLLQADIWERKANLPTTTISMRAKLVDDAQRLRVESRNVVDLDFEP
jgi:tetratricopeptide (TPR) repeat protein